MSNILKTYIKPSGDTCATGNSMSCIKNGILYHTCDPAGGDKKGCDFNDVVRNECRSCGSYDETVLTMCSNQPSNINELCPPSSPSKKHNKPIHNKPDNDKPDNDKPDNDKPDNDKPNDVKPDNSKITDNTFGHFFFNTTSGILLFVFLCIVVLLLIVFMVLYFTNKNKFIKQ